MAKIFIRKIRAGEMRVEGVPDLWRDAVEKLLKDSEE